MPERRKTKRVPCRLRCRVAKGREQVRSRIIDVSEGGLCLILPVWLKPNQKFEISIDVPGTGLARVHAEIWHIRRERIQSTNNRVWIAGAMLVDADDAYAKLLAAAGAVSRDIDPAAPGKPNRPGLTKAPEPIDAIDAIEPTVYRIRCKETGGPRSRVLSLAADSKEQARSLAIRDLGPAWTVLEIREA